MHAYRLTLGALTILVALIAAGCGMPATPPATPSAAGMDHGTMTDQADQPFDATFIESMIRHHEGAVAMATQALTESERSEIKALAEAIINAQQAEIRQLQAWRAAWYPDLPPGAGMGMDMGPMTVAEGQEPFDQRFIDAMIPHHESAIAMARDALQKAEHQEIKTLAEAIISAQEAEIAQMRAWRSAWFSASP
jgi:uncharacterized protein (DUF305 family)